MSLTMTVCGRTDGDVRGAVCFNAAVDVVPDPWQPADDSFHLIVVVLLAVSRRAAATAPVSGGGGAPAAQLARQ